MTQVIIVFIAILAVSVAAVDLPEFLHVCKHNNPNMDQCITDSVMHIRPYLVEGVPKYNIPSLEPLLLNKLIFMGDSHSITISANDVKAYGASDFTVGTMKTDMENLIFKFDILLPHLYIVGRYEMDGKVLLLPIRGAGDMFCNVTGVIGSVTFKATSDPDTTGTRQFRVYEFNLKVKITDGSIRLDNLFGGDGVIGDLVNNAINSNFDSFVRELMPIIEMALSDSFREIGNSIVSEFTYDQLFPN